MRVSAKRVRQSGRAKLVIQWKGHHRECMSRYMPGKRVGLAMLLLCVCVCGAQIRITQENLKTTPTPPLLYSREMYCLSITMAHGGAKLLAEEIE